MIDRGKGRKREGKRKGRSEKKRDGKRERKRDKKREGRQEMLGTEEEAPGS